MMIVKKQLFAFLFALKRLGQFIGVVHNRNAIEQLDYELEISMR